MTTLGMDLMEKTPLSPTLPLIIVREWAQFEKKF